MYIKWPKIKINTDDNKIVEAIAPLIISASRATDIPAFHTKWFLNRLEKGYVIWVNPFNKKIQYVSLKKTSLIVFWTKNPKPLIPFLDKISEKGIDFYFHFTLNDYENEGLEPNVPKLRERLSIFKALSEKIGKEKVIWRFDPIIILPNMKTKDILYKIWNLGKELIFYTNKLVISFIDIVRYKKVQKNLQKFFSFSSTTDVYKLEPTFKQQIEIGEGLSHILRKFRKYNPNFTIATCAERIDLDKFGIKHNKCIDDGLIKKVFPNNSNLISFLKSNSLFEESSHSLKDKGQRPECRCIYSKDIGAYNTCKHLCVYCYANHSPKIVYRNLKNLDLSSESLLPFTKDTRET